MSEAEQAKATFAAGCFWGVEAAFRAVPGVLATAVGFCGGRSVEPSYAQVCGGRTGHAEAVTLEYDPARVDYDALLREFWDCHDPTQWHRQGADVGSQYRSVIFCHDEAQMLMAQASREAEQASGRHRGRIVSEIRLLTTFYFAEEEHQQYMEKLHLGLKQDLLAP